jgi:hypothetical protein
MDWQALSTLAIPFGILVFSCMLSWYFVRNRSLLGSSGRYYLVALLVLSAIVIGGLGLYPHLAANVPNSTRHALDTYRIALGNFDCGIIVTLGLLGELKRLSDWLDRSRKAKNP